MLELYDSSSKLDGLKEFSPHRLLIKQSAFMVEFKGVSSNTPVITNEYSFLFIITEICEPIIEPTYPNLLARERLIQIE